MFLTDIENPFNTRARSALLLYRYRKETVLLLSVRCSDLSYRNDIYLIPVIFTDSPLHPASK